MSQVKDYYRCADAFKVIQRTQVLKWLNPARNFFQIELRCNKRWEAKHIHPANPSRAVRARQLTSLGWPTKASDALHQVCSSLSFDGIRGSGDGGEQMPPVNLVEQRRCARHQSVCQSFNRAWKCLEITRTILTANCGTERREGVHRWYHERVSWLHWG